MRKIVGKCRNRALLLGIRWLRYHRDFRGEARRHLAIAFAFGDFLTVIQGFERTRDFTLAKEHPDLAKDTRVTLSFSAAFMTAISSGETRDTILGGRLALIQPKNGYRFSVEAILLGRLVHAKTRERVLDLGAGCGVISIMIASLYRAREVVAIEIQTHLAELIARNAALNDLGSLRAICADLRHRKIAGVEPASFDLVIANPPYRATSSGRENPNHGRRVARGESSATFADFVAAARRYARNGGRVAFVFTARRAAELISTMRAKKLEPKRIRFVHPRIAMPASVMIVEARVGGGIEASIEPPLILYDRPGIYTNEARALLSSL